MVNNNRAAIAMRREKVWICVVEGMQTSQIAEYLKVSKKTVSQDIRFMTKDSQQFLNETARETLPFMLKRAITALEFVLYKCFQRYEKDGNLFALKLIIDCVKEITNQQVNSVSLLAVRKITEKANTLGINLEYEDGR